ncbi:MAG: kelch repeat-containing protein [bacterium]|nr:kelch repeat-containing protein [bacterium]
MKKRILSLIIAAAMISAAVPVFAENSTEAIIPVKEISAEEIVETEEPLIELPEESSNELSVKPMLEPEETQAAQTAEPMVENTIAPSDTENENIVEADVTENGEAEETPEDVGEYKYGAIYEGTSNYSTADINDIETAVGIDVAEYVSDEELMIQPQELTDNIGGWETYSSMSEGKSYMASAVAGNKIYTFGGKKSDSVITTTEVFDTGSTEGTWTRKTAMPEGRYKHTALYNNGNIFICGGYNAKGEAVSEIAVYNVENDTWADNGIITPNNKTNYASGMYNGELYIFGGKENGVLSKNSYKYNFTTNTWTQVMSVPRTTNDAKAAATSYGFYVLYNTEVMKYDIAKNSFELVDHLPGSIIDYDFIVRDYTSTSAVTPSTADALLVSGGRENADSVSLASVKVRANTDYTFKKPWEPEWYNDLRLIRGLAAHNMVEVNGYIYVFGGQISANEEQRLMFRRSLDEWHDDYPDNNVYDWMADYAYGSINHKNDIDRFRFTPSVTGKYEVKTFDAIHTNNLGYKYHVRVKEENTGNVVTDADLPVNLGGIPMESGKSYIVEIKDTAATWTGNYYFKMNMVTDDAPDVIDEAIELPLETTVSKTFLGKLDVDCMYFDIPATGMYDVEVISNGKTVATVKINDNTTKKNLLYNYKNSEGTVENIKFNKGRYYISLSAPGTEYDYSNPAYTVRISNTALYKQMNTARYRHGLAAVDGKLYAVGGLNSEYKTETMIEAYTPSTGMWQKVANSENTVRQGTSTIAVGSKIYLVGGIDDYSRSAMTYYPLDDSIMIYDTSNNTWEGSGDLGIDRERVGLAEKDGNIYIAGGRTYGETEYSNAIQVYNTSTGELTDYPVSLPTGIVDPQIFFSNDTMYVVGGVDSDGYSGKVYALENDIWVQKASMPYASKYMRGKSFNDNFYCAAVNNSGDVDVLKYDSIDDEWTYIYGSYSNINGFIENRSYYAVDILNGMLYISGGYSSKDDEIKNDIHCIDVVTDISAMDTAIPVRTIGFEYEQTVNDDTTGAPEILGVNAKVLDSSRGIYELYLTKDDYNCDTRNVPFFFWSAREGMFSALNDDYTRVKFYADKGTDNRQVKVIVGIGDGRGYVDKKAFLLDGNNETE